MNKTIALKLININKTFYIRDKNSNSLRDKVFNLFFSSSKRAIKAIRNVDFEVYKGEILGIIGHNGSGKSTLLRIMLGAFRPDKGGEIDVDGKIIRLSLGMGFDPSLTARENIYVNGSILGLSFKQIGKKFHKIIEFAELQNFVDTKVQYFSSGMHSRLAFSIAIHADADIFLMDEFFGGVGDANFQKKSQRVFEEVMLKQNRTIVLVSHDLNTIKKYCSRVVLLERGELVKIGSPEQVIPIYLELMATKTEVGGVS